VGQYQKGKTNLDFTEARDSEWQWHRLGYMQGCISLQTDTHASTPPVSFLQAGCPSCRPTNSVKAKFVRACEIHINIIIVVQKIVFVIIYNFHCQVLCRYFYNYHFKLSWFR